MATSKRLNDGEIDEERSAKKIMFEEGADATAPVNRKDGTEYVRSLQGIPDEIS